MQLNYRYYFVISLLLGLLSPVAQAAITCTMLTPTTTLSPPTITIQRDLPVGAPIGNLVTTGYISAFNCTGSNTIYPPWVSSQAYGVRAYGTYVMSINGRRIYATGIDGVGYAVYLASSSNCATEQWVDGSATADGNTDIRILCAKSGLMPVQPITIRIGIQLYKTAQNTGSGTVAGSKKVAAVVFRNNMNNNSSAWITPEPSIIMSSFNVTTIACTVNSSVISVAMDTVEKRAFSGAGSWQGGSNTKNFTIPLTCNAGTKVNLQVDGNVQNAQQGVLNITQGNGSASGIGVQLLHNSLPLVLSAANSFGTVPSEGIYNLSLQARYYQTGVDVEPGTANAVANFTVTYQ